MKTYPNFKIFANLILIVFLILMTYSCEYETSKESAQYIKDPKVGDVYFIEEPYGEFTLMKIANADKSVIDFNINKFNHSMARELDASYNNLKYKTTKYLDQDEYYWPDSLKTYQKSELIKLYDHKIIYEIKRQ